jgi:hypothetical protein
MIGYAINFEALKSLDRTHNKTAEQPSDPTTRQLGFHSMHWPIKLWISWLVVEIWWPAYRRSQ